MVEVDYRDSGNDEYVTIIIDISSIDDGELLSLTSY